jgi:uncharacterized protein YndB with AHSA1/START domain
MSSIRVATFIAAPRAEVWEALRDIGSHVRWMHDALAIRFTSRRQQGVGTTFDCDSRLGPLRLTDRMEVIEWKPGRAMTVRHVGVVRGVGRFQLKRRRGGTLFVWKEVLRFPWWMGGAVGAEIAAPFFRRMWKKNLANLKAIVEAAP